MNKKKIVFLAPYPTVENIKEGMMQRVAAVDAMFDDQQWEKTYIEPSFKSFSNSRIEVAPNVFQYSLSIWTGRGKILQLINNADTVYCHSLYGISVAGLRYWKNICCKNVIWDVHGIIPEELAFAGASPFKVKLFSRLERLVVYHVGKIVTVTESMRNHLMMKYPNCKAKFYTYAILPVTIGAEMSNDTSMPNKEIVLLYAGNTQKYQNIPMMAQSIAALIDAPLVRFEILTGSPGAMRDILNEYGIADRDNVHINSVAPSELASYYARAQYGYVLRDDIDVNNVACPTKIVEYLAYGLRPIVLQPRIGDFEKLGYEYVLSESLRADNLLCSKSEINKTVYQSLVQTSNPTKFKQFIVEGPPTYNL